MTARSFWPPAEASQVDYETLRAHLLEHGRLPDGLSAARFARRGVAGLIAWPSAEPVFVAELLGAARPAWTPPHRSADVGAGRRLPVPARYRRPDAGERDARRCLVKVAIYARVSTERQSERGTIGSQLAALRDQVSAAGHELISEFIDDGYSGARLDRPGLDALRDAAEAGLFDAVLVPISGPVGPGLRLPGARPGRAGPIWCRGAFHRRPDFATGDPQATLLTQCRG